MKASALALIVACVLLSSPAAVRAAGPPIAEDVPVRGGIAALAAAVPVAPAPDPARFVAETIRVVYSWPQTGPYSSEPMRRRIATALSTPAAGGGGDEVPVPLSAAVWSDAVFHRAIGRDDLLGAILADRSAALLCYGLAGLDDETLAFFASHPALLSHLAERAPAAFAAFGESVRVRGGRLVVPGGDAAAPAWASIVGESLDRPDRFVAQLFDADRARLAYLFDVLTHVAAPTLTVTIGPRAGGPESLKRLAALVRRAFPEWDVNVAPFVRPPADLNAFFARLRSAADAEGALALAPQAFWQTLLDRQARGTDQRIDVASLADLVLGHPASERVRRLDVFSFTTRVFGLASGNDEVVAAARGFDAYPALMLTLERMGVRTAAVYAAAADHAARIAALDPARGAIALADFQGAVALLARLVRVGTLDTAAAVPLARDLLARRLADDGRYDGAMASWLSERLLPALRPLAAGASIDDAVLTAAAGPPVTAPAVRIDWEGQRYRVDPGAAELARLRRVRDRENGVTFATALDVAAAAGRVRASAASVDAVHGAAAMLDRAAQELAASDGGGDESTLRTLREAARTLGAVKSAGEIASARRLAAPVSAASDRLLGDALLSLAYACDLGDPDGTILIAGDPSRRHDFGFGAPGRGARGRAMWEVAVVETRKGPWHLVGSALALDLAMAPLALRRISADRVPAAPMINVMQRDGFAATVAAMNPRAMSDADRDRIADAVARGRQRVDDLVGGRERADEIVRDAGLDGWRERALEWTLAHEPRRARSLFSLTELLVLGGGAPSTLNAWGGYAYPTAGCLCSRLASPGEWRRWWGLTQIGLPAILVADLPLEVAVVLHNRHLPAVLAKPVLAAAMQDFVDDTNPTDANDWLTLSRAAQAVPADRFDDYIAAATADGPLVADAPATEK